jgi:hypothetical protein
MLAVAPWPDLEAACQSAGNLPTTGCRAPVFLIDFDHQGSIGQSAGRAKDLPKPLSFREAITHVAKLGGEPRRDRVRSQRMIKKASKASGSAAIRALT